MLVHTIPASPVRCTSDQVKRQMFSPRSSLRTKLILSFSIVIVAGVFLSAIIGIKLIGNTIIAEAKNKVRFDLNSAREIYQNEAERIKIVIRLTTNRYFLIEATLNNDRSKLIEELGMIRSREGLDILTLTDNHGCVIARTRNPSVYDDYPVDEVLNWVVTRKEAVVSTQIVIEEELIKEDEELKERARIRPIPTPRAKIVSTTEQTSGMMIKAAAPVFDNDGTLIGVLYGGILLNRNYDIVDEVKDIVYRGIQHKGVDIGTTTIFQGDIRISTNVRDDDGTRAIGTRVSKEVYEQVLLEGIPWVGRAFVVNAWYITAYEPIVDLRDNIIGMLYVGMLEAPYVELRRGVTLIMLLVAGISMVLLWIIGQITTRNVTEPIFELVRATNKIAEGDLSCRVNIRSQDEIGLLADSFNKMAGKQQEYSAQFIALTKSLEERVIQKTEELEAAHDHLIRTEKISSLGKVAAGIAHEINNPLTSIMINSQLIAEEIGNDDRFKESLNLIIDETSRCTTIVKGLLDFSRQSEPEMIPASVNRLINRILMLTESQALIHNVTVIKELDKSLPEVMLDPSKIEQVLTNVLLNALDAMPESGHLFVTSRLSADGNSVEIIFRDTGYGIAEENLSKVFDPFFTTKGIEGTGLGLSVSYGIIELHDGTIDIQSEKRKGTTVTIRLPISSEGQEPRNGEA